MSETHPLTDKIVSELEGRTYDRHAHDESIWQETIDSLDEIVREHTAPKEVIVESGVRFPELPDSPVAVAATFIESGDQLQMALIGVEPVLLIQPEFEAETGIVTLLATAVDLPPAGLVQVLESLLDGAKSIVDQQAEAIAEARSAAIDAANAGA